MNEDQIKQLQKLAKIFNTDNVITQSDIEQVLTGIAAILGTYKKDTEAINSETKGAVSKLLNYVAEEHNKVLKQIKSDTQETREAVRDELKTQSDKLLKQVQSLVEEVRKTMPKDGKDADEEKIVQDVLNKIKLPEYKEYVLDAGEIISRINDLPIEADFQIDASHIKNLPQFGSKNALLVGGNRFLSKLADVAVTGLSNNQVLKWNSTTRHWENGTVSTGITIGDTITSGTQGSVLFIGASGVLAQDNSNLFWDDTNNRLGLGTSSPAYPLDLRSATFNTLGLRIGTAANGIGAFGSNAIQFYGNGIGTALLGNGGGFTGFRITSDGIYGWSDTTSVSSGLDLILARDAAGVLAQRNSTNAQAFRLYNTYTDSSNYERGRIQWSSNVFSVMTESAGTGTARDMRIGTAGASTGLYIQTAGADKWIFDAAGTFKPNTANTVDIGTSSATVKNIYYGTQLHAPAGTNTAPSILQQGTGAGIAFIDTNQFAAVIAGQYALWITRGGVIRTRADTSFGWGTSSASDAADLILSRKAAANLRLGAFSDGATAVAQTLSVQNVATGQSNVAGANFTIAGSQGTGSAAGGSIILQTAPAGGSGTSQNALVDALTLTGNSSGTVGATFAASTLISWSGASTLSSPSNGVIRLANSAATDFGRLQFGGTTSSFPAIKRSSATLQVRLADDSAYADLAVKGLTANGQYYSVRYDAGNSGTALTLDFNNGNCQLVTLTGNITFTFSNPQPGARYLLELKQDGTGSRTVTWPAAVKWSGGVAPTLTTTAGQTDIICLYYNGTNYAATSTLNFAL
jgi:hypothetical protein